MRSRTAVSSSAPRLGPSSVASASVRGVKPEMSTKRPDPLTRSGMAHPGRQRPAACPRRGTRPGCRRRRLTAADPLRIPTGLIPSPHPSEQRPSEQRLQERGRPLWLCRPSTPASWHPFMAPVCHGVPISTSATPPLPPSPAQLARDVDLVQFMSHVPTLACLIWEDDELWVAIGGFGMARIQGVPKNEAALTVKLAYRFGPR